MCWNDAFDVEGGGGGDGSGGDVVECSGEGVGDHSGGTMLTLGLCFSPFLLLIYALVVLGLPSTGMHSG